MLDHNTAIGGQLLCTAFRQEQARTVYRRLSLCRHVYKLVFVGSTPNAALFVSFQPRRVLSQVTANILSLTGTV